MRRYTGAFSVLTIKTNWVTFHHSVQRTAKEHFRVKRWNILDRWKPDWAGFCLLMTRLKGRERRGKSIIREDAANKYPLNMKQGDFVWLCVCLPNYAWTLTLGHFMLKGALIHSSLKIDVNMLRNLCHTVKHIFWGMSTAAMIDC